VPDFVEQVLAARRDMGAQDTNDGELAAFIVSPGGVGCVCLLWPHSLGSRAQSYTQAFPQTCLCLVDTYDTLS
jgi:hypothetical protein